MTIAGTGPDSSIRKFDFKRTYLNIFITQFDDNFF
jgi:hypothetical protein